MLKQIFQSQTCSVLVPEDSVEVWKLIFLQCWRNYAFASSLIATTWRSFFLQILPFSPGLTRCVFDFIYYFTWWSLVLPCALSVWTWFSGLLKCTRSQSICTVLLCFQKNVLNFCHGGLVIDCCKLTLM